MPYELISSTKDYEEKEDNFDKKEFAFCKQFLKNKQYLNKGMEDLKT